MIFAILGWWCILWLVYKEGEGQHNFESGIFFTIAALLPVVLA